MKERLHHLEKKVAQEAPMQLLRKLATLVPPPRSNLVRFHGVFAPGAKLRPRVVKQVPSSGVRVATTPARVPGGATAEGGARGPRKKREGAPDWAELLRRTFAIDVLACPRCGGRRRVLATVMGKGAKAILEHLGLGARAPPLAPARGPPEAEFDWGG